jgi:hypothetical protein
VAKQKNRCRREVPLDVHAIEQGLTPLSDALLRRLDLEDDAGAAKAVRSTLVAAYAEGILGGTTEILAELVAGVRQVPIMRWSSADLSRWLASELGTPQWTPKSLPSTSSTSEHP